MYLDNRYAVVFRYKGYAICTLKIAAPAQEDCLGYVIDDESFLGKSFESVGEAMAEIDRVKLEQI